MDIIKNSDRIQVVDCSGQATGTMFMFYDTAEKRYLTKEDFDRIDAEAGRFLCCCPECGKPMKSDEPNLFKTTCGHFGKIILSVG